MAYCMDPQLLSTAHKFTDPIMSLRLSSTNNDLQNPQCHTCTTWDVITGTAPKTVRQATVQERGPTPQNEFVITNANFSKLLRCTKKQCNAYQQSVIMRFDYDTHGCFNESVLGVDVHAL